jgi:hypothetical protein
MADQEKDRTNPTSGQKTGPGTSGSGLSSNSPQPTGAAGTSIGSGAGSSGSVDLGATGSGMSTGGNMPGRSNTTSEVSDKARQVADEAKNKARDLASSAKEQGRTMFDQQKDSAAEQVDSAAQAFRTTAKQLQGDGQSQAGRYVNMFAEQLESLGTQLRQKNMDALLRDAENLGRRSPGIFLAGSVAAGFLLARFLKSSAEHQHSSSMDRSRDDWRSGSPYLGEDSDALAGAYGSAGSDVRSSSGIAGAAGSGTSATGGTGLAGSAMEGSAIEVASPALGADGTGTGDKATPSSTSSTTKPGGNYL